MRNYLWEMSVAAFVKVTSDCENRDLINRFHFRGTDHYDARALRYDEIANTMAALSEHYKGLLSAARSQASNEFQNRGPPTDAEEQTARHLYHEAMITDGEIEKNRFFVETDVPPAETNGFLQKTVAMYRIALGWHATSCNARGRNLANQR